MPLIALPWRYVLSLLLVLGGFATVLLVQTGYTSAGFLPAEPMALTTRHLVIVILTQGLIFIALSAVFSRAFGFQSVIFAPFRNGAEMSFTPADFLKAIGGLVITYFLMAGAMAPFHREIRQYQHLNFDLIRKDGILFLIMVSTVVPFYEEYIFRGMILTTLRMPYLDWQSSPRRTGGAVFFSSLLFAASHYEGDWLIMVPIFLLAVFLSVLTVARNSLVLPIFIHSLHNLLAGSMQIWGNLKPGQ